MTKSRNQWVAATPRAPLIVTIAGLLMLGTISHGAPSGPVERFERTYTPRGPGHLTISNLNGDIAVTAWDRKYISVHATTTPRALIEEQVTGNEVVLSVKRRLLPGSANFQVSVPSDTALSLKNVIGRVDVSGVAGDLTVDSIDGDIRLLAITSGSVDVKVTTGNIFFDGKLRNDGSYSLQSVKGDIDVTLPASTAFDLKARSLSGAINLGDFISSFIGGTKLEKGISGTHLKSGTRLSLTTFAGRVVLHKK